MIADLTITGTWLPTDPDTGSHRLLAFEVPTGVSRIDVRYSVEPLGGSGSARVFLDAGLFDPAGVAFLDPTGFRGWSGSFRNEFFVSAAGSTPGYLRGPITPGTWHIITGTDREGVGSEGLRYTIEIAFTTAPHEPARPYSHYEPGIAAHGQRWYKGNLHSHTYYSDGHNSIGEMADEHLRLGLHFGALTEHNLLNPDLAEGHRPGFIWLPSEEVTTYRGHLNAWGLSHWLDFRCDTEDAMQAVIDAAHTQGALTGINHPKEDGPPWNFDLFTADCMEVWQAPWFLGNYQSLALWERLLRAGKRIVAVGGSDLHRISTPDEPYPYNLDNPTTWVRASQLSVAAILEGISRGRVFISRDAEGPQLYLSAEGNGLHAVTGDAVHLPLEGGLTVRADVRGASGLVLRLVTQEGVAHSAPILSDDFRAEYIWTEAGGQAASGPTYIRAEIIRDPGSDVDLAGDPSALWMEAMSNPLYVLPSRPVERAARAAVEVEVEVESLAPVASRARA